MAQFVITYTIVTTRRACFTVRAPEGEDSIAEERALKRLENASKSGRWPGELIEEDEIEFTVDYTEES